MRRLLTTTAAAAGALFLAAAAAAAPAAAQYPGPNGGLVYTQGSKVAVGCFSTRGQLASDGGVATSADGRHEAGVFNGGQLWTDSGVPGACPTRATQLPGFVGPGTTLAYSPKGAYLAVTRYGDVDVVDATTGAFVRDVTPNTPLRQFDPTWSVRQQIAYVGPQGLFIAPAFGGAPRLLRAGTFSDPDFSPDGSRIAYINPQHHIAIYTLATGAVQVTPLSSDHVVWSPDGTQLFLDSDNGRDAVTATIGGRILYRVTGAPVARVLAWKTPPAPVG